jgi:hypothetical protein
MPPVRASNFLNSHVAHFPAGPVVNVPSPMEGLAKPIRWMMGMRKASLPEDDFGGKRTHCRLERELHRIIFGKFSDPLF